MRTIKILKPTSVADPENLKGGDPGKIFDNSPRKSANITPFLNVPQIFKKIDRKIGGPDPLDRPPWIHPCM